MPTDLVLLGVGLLLAPALAEIAKIRIKTDKGFNWLAVAGSSYLLAAAFNYDIGFNLGSALSYGTALFSAIGLVATLIGTLLIMSSIRK